MAITEITQFQTEDGSKFDTLQAAQSYEENKATIADLEQFLYERTSMASSDAEHAAQVICEHYEVKRRV